ncbi:HypC/HybG/HupF family hydrogenase formation chaperone [Paraferrimonas haliotis]|uniref:Hydrogenase assembly protein HypC n=1 Tax=Paraferrimonas haliotis TaxID=2013866 RepID=A0AA37TWE1_9GAMM|nr:HypC/HybG/HupF family hydrogenase formation chaperone [Paraferrimonas haliotis]GLS82811.1 hydrogenase assembly protein HypC [Paraferrimonas haliotis]
MCFSIPSKVVAIDSDNQIATIDTLGQERHTSIHLLGDEVAVGDYVLVQSGFAMQTIDEQSALDSLELYQEIVTKMEQGAI